MFQIFLRWDKSFRQAGLEVPGIHGEVEDGRARVTKTIRHVGPKQAPIGGNVDPEAFFGSVVDDFVHEIRPQERLSTH